MKSTYLQKTIHFVKSYADLKLNYKLGLFFVVFLMVFMSSIYFITSRNNDQFVALQEAVTIQRLSLLDMVDEINQYVYQYVYTQDETLKGEYRTKVERSMKLFQERQAVLTFGGEFLVSRGFAKSKSERDVLFIDAEVLDELRKTDLFAKKIDELNNENKKFQKLVHNIVYAGNLLEEKGRVPNGLKLRMDLERSRASFGLKYKELSEVVKDLSNDFKSSNKAKDILNYLLILIIFLAMLWASRVYINKPVIDITNKIKDVAEGDLSIRLDDEKKDEIGTMANYINSFIINLDKAAIFASKIGEGDFGYEYSAISDKDELGLALVNMRDRLKEISNQDKIRNWSTEGMAKFADLLQMDKSNITLFYESIIVNLVKYLKANQGAIYVLNEMKEGEKHQTLTMKACYAWERIKDEHSEIIVGEGLVGQCVLERDYIHMTEVPNDFVKITSGLGEANPNAVLVSPLIVNDEIHGVIEMASFDDFEEYQIEFVQKIGETIAATIANVKVGEKTKYLLAESQEMAETMRTQEEELRQNQEEMMATQEEMNRRILELEKELEQYR